MHACTWHAFPLGGPPSLSRPADLLGPRLLLACERERCMNVKLTLLMLAGTFGPVVRPFPLAGLMGRPLPRAASPWRGGVSSAGRTPPGNSVATNAADIAATPPPATATPPATPPRVVLPAETWRPMAEAHRERIKTLAGGSLQPGDLDRNHPIFNFLFQYYFWKPTQVAQFSPGPGVLLQGVTEADLARHFVHQGILMPKYDPAADAYGVDTTALAAKPKVLKSLLANRELLLATSLRPPILNCFGLHEWAMLYTPPAPNGGSPTPATRHQALPLRVGQATINELVESR